MAILKHIAGKNADYGEAQRYLIFQYDEYTGKPIREENGLTGERARKWDWNIPERIFEEGRFQSFPVNFPIHP